MRLTPTLIRPGSEPMQQVTDARGEAHFRGILHTRWTVSCNMAGFLESRVVGVVVKPGEPQRLVVVLNWELTNPDDHMLNPQGP